MEVMEEMEVVVEEISRWCPAVHISHARFGGRVVDDAVQDIMLYMLHCTKLYEVQQRTVPILYIPHWTEWDMSVREPEGQGHPSPVPSIDAHHGNMLHAAAPAVACECIRAGEIP